MDKRLLKKHKRQVARAKEQVKVSEPDVRTPEQIKAAREASRPAVGRGNGPHSNYAAPSVRNHAGVAAHSSAKADA
ncbi:MAG: hypothetical protein ACKV22_06610 [Bryobacteraceae bacterium]|mgnify:CR=1 FL=1